MALTFIKSNKGAHLLVIDSFSYRREKVIAGKEIWRCSDYKKLKCMSRCHTKDGIITKTPGDHNHVPDQAKIEARKIINNLKERAATTTESTHEMIATSSRGLNAAVAGQFPVIRNIKQTVRRVRHENQTPLPNPASLDELVIPMEYTQAESGEQFLLHDSGPGQHRMLIFSTARNLQLLENCPNWYADGTFKTSPPLFQQVYTIHVLKYNSVIPVVFVLMNDKSTGSYVHLLMELKKLRPGLNPSTIMTDFEQAALLAFRNIFPNVVQQGCLFHLGQCIWRRIQQTADVQSRYKTDVDFALSLRQLIALAFVPPVDVISVFDELMDSTFFIDNFDDIRDLVNYFEDTWIGRPGRRGGRTTPIYSIPLWNVYQQALEDLPKTNNYVEGWHRGFSQLLGAYHPTVWKFINGLKKEQSFNELKIEQFLSGQPAQPSKKKYKEVALRIKAIVADYGNRPNLDYLRGLAHNLSFQI